MTDGENLTIVVCDWSDEGVISFPFLLLDGVGVRKHSERSKYHHVHELHPAGERRKRQTYYGNDVIALVGV